MTLCHTCSIIFFWLQIDRFQCIAASSFSWPGMVCDEDCLRSGKALVCTRAFDARDAYSYATACDLGVQSWMTRSRPVPIHGTRIVTFTPSKGLQVTSRIVSRDQGLVLR